MRRRKLVSLIVVGVVVFLAISALLARALSVSGAENAAITRLVTAEARGNPGQIAALLDGCAGDPSCRARAQANARALAHAGTVTVVQILPSAGFSFGSTVGTARVAWVVGNSLPRVQCVRVRRAGGLLEGYTIRLQHISTRIKSNIDCPRTY
jgi:hypothetical protein